VILFFSIYSRKRLRTSFWYPSSCEEMHM